MKCKYCKADCARRGEDWEKECRGYIPKTNADRIRSMSDEELAKLFGRVGFCNGIIPKSYCSRQKVCSQMCVADWLKQPYKEDT